jgi:hypothetical protein
LPEAYFANLQQQQQEAVAATGGVPEADNVGAIVGVANEEVDDILRVIERANSEMCRYGLIEQGVRLSADQVSQLGRNNIGLKEELDSVTGQGGRLRIPSELENQARARAAHEGFMQTMGDLNGKWREGKMTVDEYVTALRKFGKAHFLSVVLPSMGR